MTKAMQEIHGLSRVTKVAMRDDTETGQAITVTDDGDHVRISMSTASYPAKLTPVEARWFAQQLIQSAKRVSRKGDDV